MSSTYKISLIIPVFNVEPWLNECLDSVQNQSFQDWEAILVNDCSQDASNEILESYAKADQRYTIIQHTENMGLGAARNTGCSHAIGEFLFFLDSDDLLTYNALEDLYNTAKEYSADMVISDFHPFKDKGEKFSSKKKYPLQDSFCNLFPKENKILKWDTIEEKQDTLIDSSFTIACWSKLFRRQLWIQWNCHVPGNLRMAEDIIPVKKFFHSSEIIVTCPTVSILYRLRKSSHTGQRTKKALEILRAYPLAMEEFQSIPNWDILHLKIERFFIHSFLFYISQLIPYTYWWYFYSQYGEIIKSMKYAQKIKYFNGIHLKKWQKHSPLVFLYIVLLAFRNISRQYLIQILPSLLVQQIRKWKGKFF